MFIFYLVRHGNTENNWNSLTMGQIDTPLTEEGLKNAVVLGGELANITHAHRVAGVVVEEELDHIYSSDLGRAFITAHIIAEKLNFQSHLSAVKDLREINYGIYANRKKDEVKKECPQYKTDAAFIFPQGESYYHVQKRVIAFIKQLEKTHADKTVLLVGHSGVIRSIHAYFHGQDLQDHLNMRFSHEYIGKYVVDGEKLLTYEKINE